MRIWHYKLLPYLPELQFKGQLRELVMIMRDWRDKGATNHLLINRAMQYSKAELAAYYILYDIEYMKRYGKSIGKKYSGEFELFDTDMESGQIADNVFAGKAKLFEGWHNDEYLRICMANLYEKHLGIGQSSISDPEWLLLLDGYKYITGKEYAI